MRELDGLSHDEVASALEISPAASRQLVKRARTGLVAAAEARDADCAAIRDVLLTAHDERRRPSEHALRHLKTCGACREFRDGLKATRARLRALVPPIGMGPLAGVLHLIGGGGGRDLARSRSTAGCCAVLAAGGARRRVAGGRAPRRAAGPRPGTEAGGKTLIGKPIRAGTKLPSNVAIANVTVELPASRARSSARARVTCPPGMLADGPRACRARRTARTRIGKLRDVPALRPRHGPAERGTGRRTAAIRLRRQAAQPPRVVISVGTLCKRR